MKGIILAGGLGTRLRPLTTSISKQLLPVYDKPMIYYPLSVLMLADIREILIISTPNHLALYKELLGDGSRFGVSLHYMIQEKADGLPQAFIIGEEFINGESCALVLGDNIFYGEKFSDKLLRAKKRKAGATLFTYSVLNPQDFGVLEDDENGNLLSIEEKPIKPKSNQAITGLYFFDKECVEFSKSLSLSKRGELEIISLISKYVEHSSKIYIEKLGRGFAWLDTGTYDSLLEASSFVQTLEKRQGFKIACLEEIAFNKGWIDKKSLAMSVKLNGSSSYGKYLKKLFS